MSFLKRPFLSLEWWKEQLSLLMIVAVPQARVLLSLPLNQLPERPSIGATKAFSFLPRKCKSISADISLSWLLELTCCEHNHLIFLHLFYVCFVHSSSPRPVVVEPLEQFDDEDGLPEKLAQKNPRYQA